MDGITKADALLADKAYDADERVRQKLQEKGCMAVIPPKSNRKTPPDYDKDIYKERHLIENFFARLKHLLLPTSMRSKNIYHFHRLFKIFISSPQSHSSWQFVIFSIQKPP